MPEATPDAPVLMVNLYDLLGVHGIAEMFGRPIETVYAWRNRGLLPEPLPHQVSYRTPTWLRADLIAWGEQTGREVVNPRAGLPDPPAAKVA